MAAMVKDAFAREFITPAGRVAVRAAGGAISVVGLFLQQGGM